METMKKNDENYSDWEIEDNLENYSSPSRSEYDSNCFQIKNTDSEKRILIIAVGFLKLEYNSSATSSNELTVANIIYNTQFEAETCQETDGEESSIGLTGSEKRKLPLDLIGKNGQRWCTVSNTRKRLVIRVKPMIRMKPMIKLCSFNTDWFTAHFFCWR